MYPNMAGKKQGINGMLKFLFFPLKKNINILNINATKSPLINNEKFSLNDKSKPFIKK